MMNPKLVQLASATMPRELVDQHIIYQQRPETMHLQSWQYQQIVDKNQQEMSDQQQQMSYQQQLQPIQLPLEQQQQFNYELPVPPPVQLQLEQQQHTQDRARTLWVGGLQHWMDEAYIYSCFSYAFLVCSISHIQNKLFGYSEGYCYVEFASQEVAERVLHKFNGFLMPRTQCQPFRLQWASSADRQISFRPKASPENSTGDVHLALEGVSEHGGVSKHGVLQGKRQQYSEYKLWEGDLALGFITEPGLLQEKPKDGPEYSTLEENLGGVSEHGLLHGKRQEYSEYKLWEGDLALGFITEPGMLQEKPKESPKYLTFDKNLGPGVTDCCKSKEAFSMPHPSAKQELVKVTIPGCSTWAGRPGGRSCPWH